MESLLELGVSRFPWLADLPLDRAGCWAGTYENSPDHHGILGPIPSTPAWINACGFSGHGLMQAPEIGRTGRRADRGPARSPASTPAPLRHRALRRHATSAATSSWCSDARHRASASRSRTASRGSPWTAPTPATRSTPRAPLDWSTHATVIDDDPSVGCRHHHRHPGRPSAPAPTPTSSPACAMPLPTRPTTASTSLYSAFRRFGALARPHGRRRQRRRRRRRPQPRARRRPARGRPPSALRSPASPRLGLHPGGGHLHLLARASRCTAPPPPPVCSPNRSSAEQAVASGWPRALVSGRMDCSTAVRRTTAHLAADPRSPAPSSDTCAAPSPTRQHGTAPWKSNAPARCGPCPVHDRRNPDVPDAAPRTRPNATGSTPPSRNSLPSAINTATELDTANRANKFPRELYPEFGRLGYLGPLVPADLGRPRRRRRRVRRDRRGGRPARPGLRADRRAGTALAARLGQPTNRRSTGCAASPPASSSSPSRSARRTPAPRSRR